MAFASWASNLVLGDTNDWSDVFVHDRVTGETERVSVTSLGLEAQYASKTDGESYTSLSADGRYVAFSSEASNLVPSDTNGCENIGPNRCWDIFRHDRQTGETIRVSVNSQGSQANDGSWEPSISADGNMVAFTSDASNLVTGDTGNDCPGHGPSCSDVFVRDIQMGVTKIASVDVLGRRGTADALFSVISGDGSSVSFASSSSMTEEDLNGLTDAYFAREEGWTSVARGTVPVEQTVGGGIHGEDPSGDQSDPVNSLTGAFTTFANDVSLPGVGFDFTLSRSYNSGDSRVTALGKGWTHSFVPEVFVGREEAVVTGEDGQQLTYLSDLAGSFTPPPGGRSELTAFEDGTAELVRADQVTYQFDDSGQLSAIRDRNNNTMTLTYTGFSLTSITDTVGREISLAYDSNGFLTQVSMPDGRTVSYGYTNKRLTSVQDPGGNTTTYTYDAAGRLSEIFAQNGNRVVKNVYGSDGRVVEQIDALGNSSFFSWDPTTRTSTMTDARGNEWKDVYSDDNTLIRRIDPLGNETSFEYDPDLNVTSVTDGAGNTWTSAYDERGNLVSRVSPAPSAVEETFTYDVQNNLTSFTDGRGNMTTYDYDPEGNLIRRTQPGGQITEYSREFTNADLSTLPGHLQSGDADLSGSGLLTAITNPRGNTTSFAYDAVGNRIATTTPLGFTTSLEHDGAGRVIAQVDPRGNESGATPADFRWRFSYDATGNLLSSTDPLGNETSWIYDAAGNQTSGTDANGHLTLFSYDAANRLTKVVAPDLTETTYAYDATGNLTTRTDASAHVTTYGYDQANRLVSVTSPLGQEWTYAYDGAGNRTQIIDAAGNASATVGDGTTTFSYDEINRLVGIDYSDATPDVNFGYDANGNRTSMADAFTAQTRTYDALNRMTNVARSGPGFVYEYDGAGNVSKRTYPDGTEIFYVYDADDRLVSVTTGGATTTYAYDAAGNLTQTTLPTSNGHVESRSYDNAGRLDDVEATKGASTLFRASYTLDPVGNPTREVNAAGEKNFTYDPLGRLTEACFQATCLLPSDPFIRYNYDAVGNRLTEARPTGTTSYTYNAADQLTTASDSGGTTSFTHDPNGNQTAAGVDTFDYDLANRLSSATLGSDTITYAYDGGSNRHAATTATSQVVYQWDINGTLPLLTREESGGGSLLRRYVHGNDVISMRTGGADYYFHHDGLGSVASVTDSTGTPQWSYGYEPFGTLRTQTQQDPSAPTNLLRFTGELFDQETGLYHLRARQYDPALGRFLSTDPVPAQITDPYVATYIYVNNQPTALVDPLGEFGFRSFFSSALRVVSVAATVAAVGVAIVATGGTAAVVGASLVAVGAGSAVLAEAVDPSPCVAERVVLSAGIAVLGTGAVSAGLGVANRLVGAAADVGLQGASMINPSCDGSPVADPAPTPPETLPIEGNGK